MTLGINQTHLFFAVYAGRKRIFYLMFAVSQWEYYEPMSNSRSVSDCTFKNILVDNHYRAICWPVRSDSSSAGWRRADQGLLHFYEKKLDENRTVHYIVVVFLSWIDSSPVGVMFMEQVCDLSIDWNRSSKEVLKDQRKTTGIVSSQITNLPNQIYSQC